MGHERIYIAVDLGAESGRVIAGCVAGGKLRLETVHHFLNVPVRVNDSLHWDVLHLWREIKAGLARCAVRFRGVRSMGVDTWALDYGLLGAGDALIGNPYHYRDRRTEGIAAKMLARVSADEVYQTTGNPLMPFATLGQLFSAVCADAPALRVAQTLLTMPDLFNFWLSGQKVCESSHVINTQCYDPRARTWATDLAGKLDIPGHIFPPVVAPGTILGNLVPAVVEETGLPPLPVVTPACHDSAAAVAGIPTLEKDYLFLSCGTWSILGTEAPAPYIRPGGPPPGLMNEGGVLGNYRITSNVMGLWLVQECRRTWAAQGREYGFDELAQMAAQGPPLAAFVDPNDSRFLAPGDMPGRVQAYCRETGQAVPQDRAGILRCILEGLALRYRYGAEAVEAAAGRELRTIHLVGGGAQNGLLCQLTADATGRPVVCGPVEATACGNVIMQAVGLGDLASVQEGRELVRAATTLHTYEPDLRARDAWEAAYGRFVAQLRRASQTT